MQVYSHTTLNFNLLHSTPQAHPQSPLYLPHFPHFPSSNSTNRSLNRNPSLYTHSHTFTTHSKHTSLQIPIPSIPFSTKYFLTFVNFIVDNLPSTCYSCIISKRKLTTTCKFIKLNLTIKTKGGVE